MRTIKYKNTPSKRFMDKYANWHNLRTVCLTFDIDFAPDYMIEKVIDILNEFKTNATFFTTHPSTLLSHLINNTHFEISAHPNITPTTTQGNNLETIIHNLKQAFPSIIGNRFHLLGYSYKDLITLSKLNFIYDVSSLKFNCPFLFPSYHIDLDMVLLTYLWEDGICENTHLPMKYENINLKSPGIKIINFHPMNIFINSSNSSFRKNFVSKNPDIMNCPKRIADAYHFPSDGSETVLRNLLRYLRRKNCETICLKELVCAYKKSAIKPSIHHTK